jgi:hypothetical protein
MDPQIFIDQCIQQAKIYNYKGYNLDWEPTEGVTIDDSYAYAEFIDTFANALHNEGLILSVDIAQWGSPSIWNYTAIANTTVDKGISMGTYTSNDDSFNKQLTNLITAFGAEKSGVGLMTVNASTNEPMPLSEVEYRFEQLLTQGVNEVDIWCMPIPENWFPLLEKYVFG